LTQWNLNLSRRDEEYLIRKLKLDIHSSISLAVQTKNWLLQRENVQDAKEENQILRNQLLKSKVSNSDLIRRKLDAETRISEYHADNIDVIGSKPSAQAKQAMSHYVNGTKPVDEESLRCPDCALFQTNSRQPIEWQIDYLTKHVQNFHKRDFTETEADEIAELIK